jgi:ankyrin repeat protein
MIRACSAFCLAVILACGGPSSELVDAAARGDEARVKELLASGSDPNASGSDDWTPLTVAALEGQTSIVALLLDAGARIDLAEGGGNSPLYWAAFGGNADSTRLLLARGASDLAGCETCEKPSEVAERRGHHDIATLIRDSAH